MQGSMAFVIGLQKSWRTAGERRTALISAGNRDGRSSLQPYVARLAMMRETDVRQRQCEVAIIGAGTAGLKAYKAAVARGADTLLIERGPGGSTCTRVGCMPSKLLIAAARAAANARGAGLFGVEVSGVTVDGAAVLGRVRAERDGFVASVINDYHAIPADRRIQGDARFTGPTTLAIGDEFVIQAKAIVIAAGAHPLVPESLAAVTLLVRTHETIFELDMLPAAMAVVGAGALGIELAQAFARLGVAVTVLDSAKAVGNLGDPAANEAAIAALGKEFDLRLGVEVSAEMADGRARLRCTGESEGEIVVDLVLAATGRPPSLEGLGLDKAGVPLDEHGTPEFDETTRRCGDTSVFLAGDAGAWRPVLHEAARGGRIAGHVAAGGEASRPLPRFQVAFTEPNLVEVGVPFKELPEGAKIGCATMVDNGRAVVDGKNEGVVRLYGDRNGLLIGASIVADGGEHMGHIVALGIDRGISVADFADGAWYHPTVEEALQTAARDLAGIAD